MTDEERNLIEKLRKVEALFAGTSFAGERDAAAGAMERIRQKLQELRAADPTTEHQFTIRDPWARQLFLALARRYQIRPFRYRPQHRTSDDGRREGPESVHSRDALAGVIRLADILHAHLARITERVIAESIHGDCSDAPEEPAGVFAAGTE